MITPPDTPILIHPEYIELFGTALVAILASSGFWVYISRMQERSDARNKVLIGLAHDRVIYLGLTYMKRGWISKDEYENLHDYLYIPYKELGGNGSAQRIMEAVKNLPIRVITLEEYNSADPAFHEQPVQDPPTTRKRRKNENTVQR